MSHPRALTISAVLLLLINSYSFAQESDPFAYASRIQPSADAWQMARHGEISPDLHTGTMAWSLPLYTYKDEDFTVPISLDYRFDGCRPSQPAGVVGMGWMLNCGGVITRQVVGLPDDYVRQVVYVDTEEEQHESWEVGFYFAAINHDYIPSFALGDSLASNAFMKTNHCAGQTSPFLLDLNNNALVSMMGATPMFSRNGIQFNFGVMSGGPYFDSSSDVYHFSLPDLSGDFIIMPDGSIKVFNCSVPEGEVEVSIIFSQLIQYNRIIIRHRGYIYEFGGDVNHLEYTFEASTGAYNDPTQDTRFCFTALRLNTITAPNGRQAVFDHTALSPCGTMTWKGAVKYRLHGIMGQPNIVYPSVSNGISRPIQAVIVDGDTLVRFNYADKTQVEFGYSAFHSLTQNQYNNIRPLGQGFTTPITDQSFNKANRLASVVFHNRLGNLIDSLSLTQHYTSSMNGHSSKMFLDTVQGNNGRYAFTYGFVNNDDYPPVDTVATDHWGFWNGGSEPYSDSASHRQRTSLYDLPTSSRNPDSTRTLHGSLRRIDYPTGGWSLIDYECNRVDKRIDIDTDGPISGYSLFDCPDMIVGGARVKRITSYAGFSGTFVESVEYDYHHSGTLMRMPRYFMDVSATFFLRAFQFLEDPPSWHPDDAQGNYVLSIYDGTGLSGDGAGSHIGYDTVSVRFSDGSFEEQHFCGYQNRPDLFLSYYPLGPVQEDGRFCEKMLTFNFAVSPELEAPVKGFIMLSELSRDSLFRNAMLANIRLGDYSSMRGKPVTDMTYGADSVLIKRTDYSWQVETAATAPGVFNLFSNFLSANRTFIQPRLDSVITTEYLPGGGSLSDTTLYTYNGLGQQTIVEKRGFDGDVRRSRLRYEHEADTTAPRANVSDVVTTRNAANGNNSLEYVTSLNHFDYDTDSARRHLPIKAASYCKPLPWMSAVSSGDTLWFSPVAPCDTLVRTLSYDAKQRPSVLSLPGNAYLSFVWDTAGRYVLSREENGLAMKSSYAWKDMVGLTRLTAPTGRSEWYGYDEKNRLSKIYRADSVLVKQYDYHIYSEDTTLGPSSIKQTIWRTADKNNREIAYYDGLGYPIQTVRTSTEINGGHIVTPIAYDALRRDDVKTYLPYAAQYATYDTAAFRKQEHHYIGYGADSLYAYTEKEYGTSPAGRLLSVRQPGKAYADSAKRVIYEYRTNIATDSVLNMYVTVDTLPKLKVGPGYLPAAKLLLTKTIDEDGCTSEVFTNSSGKTILSRQRTGGQRLDTYFVYDLRDSLVCVLQPEGAALIAQNASYNILQPVSVHSMAVIPTTLDILLEKYAFLYTYDSWGRLRLKKKPGAAVEEFVMDDRGRVALSRDGNLREGGKWLFSEYDTYNALTRRSLTNLSVSLDTLWKAMAVQVDSEVHDMRDTTWLWPYYYQQDPDIALYGRTANLAAGDSLFNDSLDYYGNVESAGNDPVLGHYIVFEMEPYYVGNSVCLFVSGQCDTIITNWPAIFADALTNKTLLEEHLYNRGDNPAMPQNLAFQDVTSIVLQADLGSSLNLEVWQRQLLLPPGRTVPGDTLRYVERTFWYDTLGTLVQTVERNALGGISRTSAKYDYLGNVITSEERHSVAGNNTPAIKRMTFSYDKQGRIASEGVTVNGNAATTGTMFDYDLLGRQTYAYWSREDGYEMSENCFYDIRGRLTDKEVYRITPYEPTGGDNGGGGNGDGDDEEEEEEQESIETLVFGLYLRYFNPVKQSSQRRWNGLISEIAHQHGENATIITNGYCYDNAGRLTDNIRYDGTQLTDKFTERNLTYDRNGNILTLKRYGATSNAPQDNLAYTYNGNKLTQLNNSGSVAGSYTYTYDNNGNTLSDSRRGLSFSWNHLNLPASITSNTSGASSTIVDYTYLADGTKAITSSGNEGYAYLGTLTYKLNSGTWSLESVPFTGGRFIANSTGGFDEYRYITDHLGSTRLIVKGYDYQTDERNDYYPFGMRIADNTLPTAASNRWRFSGKEIQTLGNIGLVDFGARLYDNFRGQWPTQDAMAESYSKLSPYSYCSGNPISLVDNDGRWLETAWDAANITLDIQSLALNINQGNVGAAIIDAGCLVLDVAAIVIPFVPGGAGAVTKSAKAVEVSVDVGKFANKAIDAAIASSKAEMTIDIAMPAIDATATGIKDLHRPYIRKSTRTAVEKTGLKGIDGKYLDANELTPIEGKYDLGHKYGKEYRSMKKDAQQKGLSQKQFNDMMNDPALYQIEDPHINRSHKYEKRDL